MMGRQGKGREERLEEGKGRVEINKGIGRQGRWEVEGMGKKRKGGLESEGKQIGKEGERKRSDRIRWNGIEDEG